MIAALTKFIDGIAARFRKPEPSPAVAAARSFQLLTQYPLPETFVMSEMQEGRCFFCGGHEWREGPSGGMCTNIHCDDCGQGVNVCAIQGQVLMAETIGVHAPVREAYMASPLGKNGRRIRETIH